MSSCIYCGDSESPFTIEHVLPKAFGAFRDALTLQEIVCANCNQKFGDTIDRKLARDSIDGLNRFFRASAPGAELKTAGKASSLRHVVASGPLEGAHTYPEQRAGRAIARPKPQVGFSLEADGPFEWWETSSLPSLDAIKGRYPPGSNLHLSFLEVDEPEAVLAELERIGLKANWGSLVESRPAGWESPVYRIETIQKFTDDFGRALAKVGFNYLAARAGGQICRLPLFDEIRSYVRGAQRPSWFKLVASKHPFEVSAPLAGSHYLGVVASGAASPVLGLISFHGHLNYRLKLSERGPATANFYAAHYFDCAALEAHKLR